MMNYATLGTANRYRTATYAQSVNIDSFILITALMDREKLKAWYSWEIKFCKIPGKIKNDIVALSIAGIIAKKIFYGGKN